MNSAPTSYDDLPPKPPPSNVIQNWPKPPIQNWPTPPPSNMQNSKPSIGRRTSRAFARYSIVFLIGIGVTLAWQSYSDEAMEMIRTEAPSLAWLLPVSTAKPPPDDQASATAAVASAELVQQLKPMAFDLAIVRRSVEQLATTVEQLAAKQDQLAAKQDQMSHIAVLKSVEPPPQPRAVPPRKPPQPTAQSSATQSSSVPAPPPPTGQPLR